MGEKSKSIEHMLQKKTVMLGKGEGVQTFTQGGTHLVFMSRLLNAACAHRSYQDVRGQLWYCHVVLGPSLFRGIPAEDPGCLPEWSRTGEQTCRLKPPLRTDAVA